MRCAPCSQPAPIMGAAEMGQGTPVNVEYVSANPTGPMHVGHCRGAVFGDALANLLALRRLRGDARVLHQRRRRPGRRARPLGAVCATARRSARTSAPIPDGLYPGDYLKPVGAALVAEYGHDLLNRPDERRLPVVRQKAIDMMMAEIRDDLAALNVKHDVFFSERSLIAGPTRSGGARRSPSCARRGTSTKAGCRRRRARPSRTGRIASRRCSAPPISATTSIGR